MLEKCKGFYGDVEIISDRPSLLAFRNALYIPLGDPHSSAGLFDSGRKAIPAASYFRGPDLAYLAPHCTPYRYSDIHAATGEETYLYCGHMHDHFGHFLLSSFSRFWPFVEPDFLKSIRIIVHAAIGMAEFLSQHPFAVDLFAAIGLRPENFVTFREPTRIRHAVVVAPSFEETSFAHSAFAVLGHYAGSRLSQHLSENKCCAPKWLSKERLTAGVRRAINESDLTALLRKKGADIVFPEMLSLSEQAALFRDSPLVGGFVGSALHASILAPGRALVAVSDSEVIMSSFPLLDGVNGAKATYLGVKPTDLTSTPDDSSSFDSLFFISDPNEWPQA